jgi:hypothetical protein
VRVPAGWRRYAELFLERLSTIRSKKDGSIPKPHWAKNNWAPQLTSYIKVCDTALGCGTCVFNVEGVCYMYEYRACWFVLWCVP